MEGRDFFGKEGKGAQRIVFALNRSGNPVNISVKDNISGMSAEMTESSDNAASGCIVEAVPGEETSLKVGPYGVTFVIYKSKTQ